MSVIILTEEQMDVLRTSIGPVPVCDRDGVTLGTVDPDLRHELTIEIQCRSSDDDISYPSEEVSAMLRFLEQVRAREGRPIDKARLDQLIKQFHDNYDGR